MKNRLAIIGIVSALSLTVIACGGGQNKPVEFEEDTIRWAVVKDSTVYGICGDGSAMNTLELLIDNGDTMVVSVTDAKDAGQVFGNYAIGDRMAVMMKKKDVAKKVINLSALLGNWVMPNPLDGSSELGIKIKEGGIVEGIEQSTIIYKTWKIFNGQLEIVSQRDGGGDFEETNRYDLVLLSPDSLVFKDAEDVFEYGRQNVQSQKSKIKLEEASFDDFKL